MSGAYYNDNEPYVCQWLRNLIAAGLIAPGDVDERSIKDVKPDDIRGYTQAHFFAGIGGWSYALRLAGWPDTEPCWTGSCPCQPLSGAGQRKGHADERHLWPAFHSLISECKPSTIFGEQVASKDGREWLAGIRADLEALGYACGAADLPAASAGAPHKRQRLFWMADADGRHAGTEGLQRGRQYGQRWEDGRTDSGLADTGHGSRTSRIPWREQQSVSSVIARSSGAGEGGLGNASGTGLPLGSISADGRTTIRDEMSAAVAPSSPWSGAEWVVCSDGKQRRIKPSILPLAHGVSARMGKLRGAGNALVPQVAAEFIGAFMELRPLLVSLPAGSAKS